MTRIHILGASGSGTTTLGRALADRLHCSHFDSDDYYWIKTDPPFQTKRDIPPRQELLGKSLAISERWILSGSLCGWGDLFIPRFTLVVYLWVPRETRMKRLIEREKARYGPSIDPGGPMHDQHREFIDWAAAYDAGIMTGRSRRVHDEWLSKLQCPIIRFEDDGSAEQHIAEIVRRLQILLPSYTD